MKHELRGRHEVAKKRQLYDDIEVGSAVIVLDWKVRARVA